jgi:hypothetical protein
MNKLNKIMKKATVEKENKLVKKENKTAKKEIKILKNVQ